MRRFAFAAALVLATATVAGATGGFFCEAKDENLTFSTSGGISHGMGGAILDYTAELEITAQVAPKALRNPVLDEGLVHHWLDYPELRLHFYAETTAEEEFASLDLILKTEATEDDDLTYKGQYTLSIFDGATGEVFTLTGDVTCGGE